MIKIYDKNINEAIKNLKNVAKFEETTSLYVTVKNPLKVQNFNLEINFFKKGYYVSASDSEANKSLLTKNKFTQISYQQFINLKKKQCKKLILIDSALSDDILKKHLPKTKYFLNKPIIHRDTSTLSQSLSLCNNSTKIKVTNKVSFGIPICKFKNIALESVRLVINKVIEYFDSVPQKVSIKKLYLKNTMGKSTIIKLTK